MPEFSHERSDPSANRYFWIYTIVISNHGSRPVKLVSRRWTITDAEGHREEITGPGVVGETPTLHPGESFRYASGCPLSTPSGIMVGAYQMLDENGHMFSVDIPAFSLDSPLQKRILN